MINYADGSYVTKGYDMNAQAFDAVESKFRKEAAGGSGGRSLNSLDSNNDQTMKLQPDVAYYSDGWLYMAARGPKPVSAIKAQNYYDYAHPGVMALKIDKATCAPAADQAAAFALTCCERSPEITSDVHSAWGVMNGGALQIWAVDQAGTGSVQQYDVYSACAAIGVDASVMHADPSPHDGDATNEGETEPTADVDPPESTR